MLATETNTSFRNFLAIEDFEFIFADQTTWFKILGEISSDITALRLKMVAILYWPQRVNKPRQNGRHSADDLFKFIFLYEN